jgi:hypothetical protein
MSAVETLTLTQADTAAILRRKLGDLRSWPDFLADNIRGKQNICGHVLMPCCRMKGVTGERPRYSSSDILAFVEKVLRDEPQAGPTPMAPVKLYIDLSRPWHENRFDRRGLPLPASFKTPSPSGTYSYVS